jgi:GntR family transcriptional regulator/GntR family frlABCD operon transcriptional regulator
MKSTPRYKAVHQYIKKLIISGELVEGALLPSENELCERFQVTRPTVRQALTSLVQDGYIYKHHGKGSIVASQHKTLGLLSFKGFSEVLKETPEAVDTKVLEGPKVQDWPEDFFYPLSSKVLKQGCLFIKRLRLVNASPVMLEYTWLPNKNLTGFTEITFDRYSLFGTLGSKYHIEVSSVDQHIRAIVANGKTAPALDLEVGAPLLHIYRKYGTNQKDFNLYSSLFCNTDKYALSSEFK